MADRLQTFVQLLFKRETARSKAGQSDGELLTAYLTTRDEAAFEALAKRHAAMVWGVCRRTLGNDHDAEDAFQATFLVLASKAASIKPSGMVGNWLYGVARSTALKARLLIRRRRIKENHAARSPAQIQCSDAEKGELRQVLDEELSRLPAKYRVPIILCDLEGLARREASARLGWLEGTLSGRLSRARALLGKRLLRRGFGISVGTGAASLVCPVTTSADTPLMLLSAVLEAAFVHGSDTATTAKISATATTLAKGMARSMLYTTLTRAAAMVLVLTTLVGGVGMALHRVNAGQQQATRPNKKDDQPKQINPSAVDHKEADCIAGLLAAAMLEWECRWKEYQAGRGTLDFLLDASRRLLQADLEKAHNKIERVTARKSHFNRVTEIEKINKLRYEAGKVATQDLEQSRFYRCEAELNLLREKKK